jgi:hypothetical protein
LHSVDPPVAGPRQAVALLVAGGGVQRCGAAEVVGVLDDHPTMTADDRRA